MKKVLLGAVIAVSAMACQESLEDRAARECREYTEQKCPTPTVNNTRMDSLVFEKGTHTFHYYYTFSGLADNAAAINLQKKQLREMLRNALRAETSVKNYKDAGYNFRYTYHSMAQPNVVLLDEIFNQKDYK